MDTSSRSLALGVFCGIANGPSAAYAETAAALGVELATRGHSLVYGAGGIGLMGAVANGVASAGGAITGVIPRFLRERETGDHLPPQEIVLTEDLLERKRVMIERSDAFIALPGGYGTLDEVVEVISMAALGADVGPVVLVDVNDDWRTFRVLVDDLHARGFTRRNDLYHVVGSVSEALDLVQRELAPAELTSTAS
ncbi:TIGR00730 family Rossman fold protein [Lentzea sp. CA-135723]|uniref:LOG family protein n=1 Tax=Lentzea sp. CA-135723 TaxID=3239950 RepID=UPI003D8B8BD6